LQIYELKYFMTILIINQKGNIKSISNMLLKCGVNSKITEDPSDLINANKVILPGVGSFDYAMNFLKENKLDEAIKIFIRKKTNYLLGICLGMQLLFEDSEEGVEKGLGLIKGNIIKFKSNNISFKIPHMGWNYVEKNSSISKFNLIKQRFYFAHSYYAKIKNDNLNSYTSNYIEKFPAIVEHENILGFQFHPEKSHIYGKNILNEFIKL